jgi:hypothetical protein
MKKLILLSFIILGCSSEYKKPAITHPVGECNDAFVAEAAALSAVASCMPRRTYHFDETKEFLSISIYGNTLFIADAQALLIMMEQAKQDGLLKEYKEIAHDDAGGGLFCAEIEPGADKNQVFTEFREFSTHPTQTIYQVISTTDCELDGI